MKSFRLNLSKFNLPSDERTVNRLFVSAYISSNLLNTPQSAYLSNYIIEKGDSEYEAFLQFINEMPDQISLEKLVKMFECVISPADRIVTGAVYTPIEVRRYILKQCLGDYDQLDLCNVRLADLACGCGAFLMDASKIIHQTTGKLYSEIFRDNIFGIDIQEYAIERTKILLSLLALSDGEDLDFTFNLLCCDTLDYKWDHWNALYDGFHVIVGNPPYVCSRNLSSATRQKLLAYEVCHSGHPDLYIPFFEIAVDMLLPNGRLGYITMNTFLRSVNGKSLRRYFSQSGISINVVDFRGYQVFESKTTYTCIVYIDKSDRTSMVRYAVKETGIMTDAIPMTCIPYSRLDHNQGWNINEFNYTASIQNVGIQLKDYCKSRHGIATLCNDVYIFKPTHQDKKYFYLENRGKAYAIEKSICRDIVNPNKLNSSDDFPSLIEKVIYPYNIKNGKAVIIAPSDLLRDYPKAWIYFNEMSDILHARDKGNIDSYPYWYAYGRTQSLVLPRYKLFFPKYANVPLQCVIYDDPAILLYNGLAFVSDDLRQLQILKKILESQIFWGYVKNNGKPYASGYYSLSGVDIKHFGIPRMSREDEDELLSITDASSVECWLEKRYASEIGGMFLEDNSK